MRYLVAILFAVLISIPALGQNTVNSRILVPTTTQTAAASDLIVEVSNPYSRTGYLIVNVTNEVGDSSLQITAYLYDQQGNYVVSLYPTAITAAGVYTYLLGDGAAAATLGITAVSKLPLSTNSRFKFAVAGADTSFDIEASLELVPQ